MVLNAFSNWIVIKSTQVPNVQNHRCPMSMIIVIDGDQYVVILFKVDGGISFQYHSKQFFFVQKVNGNFFKMCVEKVIECLSVNSFFWKRLTLITKCTHQQFYHITTQDPLLN